MYRATVTHYLRCSPRTAYQSTLTVGPLERCIAAALAHGPGASVHVWRPYGEVVDTGLHVYGDRGRIRLIGSVASVAPV